MVQEKSGVQRICIDADVIESVCRAGVFQHVKDGWKEAFCALMVAFLGVIWSGCIMISLSWT
ncbi:hypothetical protein [Ascidiaceihabitans sp.]|uniref:hypothetical protein n=1 Tax=Ascidiaceihabitans sp. TaxID=1872644 RepID=UPI003296ACE2